MNGYDNETDAGKISGGDAAEVDEIAAEIEEDTNESVVDDNHEASEALSDDATVTDTKLNAESPDFSEDKTTPPRNDYPQKPA